MASKRKPRNTSQRRMCGGLKFPHRKGSLASPGYAKRTGMHGCMFNGVLEYALYNAAHEESRNHQLTEQGAS